MILIPTLSTALKGKQLLIFDFDGTIANTSSLHAQAFSDTLAQLDISVCYPQIAGMRTTEAFLVCFDHHGLNPPSPEVLSLLVAEKQRRVRELITTELKPMLFMDSFLHWAKSRFQMALVTSGSRATVSLALGKLGYQSLFMTKIFAEDVNEGKPHPEGFQLALMIHNCQPANALVFEDSDAGFQAALNASIPFVDARCFASSM